MDGSSSSSPSLSAPPLPNVDMLRTMMEMMTQQREDNAVLRAEVTSLRQEMESNVRSMTRRHSMMLPLAGPATPLPGPSPPKVSSMTNSAYAHLRTTPASGPAVHSLQAGGRPSIGSTSNRFGTYEEVDDLDHEEEYEEVVDGDSEEDEEVKAQPKVKNHGQRRGKVSVNDEKEKAKLAKVMAKRAAPSPFSGEKESEKEGVEQWVVDANEYLDSQFGQLAHAYPRERLQLIKGYIKGTAGIWLTAALQTDPSQTWETLQGPFVEFIRGGRESRSLWLEKMKTLVYGRGKCKDLLGLEQEFEQLRIKLYPTSSTDMSMNEVVGREYAEAIRRGSPQLYKEMLRILGGKEEITLSEWKTAAVMAAKIEALTANSQRSNGANGQQSHNRWAQGNRYGSLAVQEMNTEQGSEDSTEKAEGQAGADVQQMQGRKSSTSGYKPGSFRPRGPYLPPDEWKVVVDKNLCKQCYKAGHHIGDPSCPDKGKPKRRPTQAELKA
jgi:hypothetical protein